MGRKPGEEELAEYRVVVQGRLEDEWSEWLGGMEVACERRRDGANITILTGTVADQSALRGVLARIWDLNLTVLSVSRIGGDRKQRRRKAK